MRGTEFNELKALCAIVEHGSFARAAAQLRVSPSALSQTIRSLEERLGVRLLNRTTRSVAPSEAGARLLARLAPLLEDLDAAIADARGARDTIAGPLRINAPRVAVRYLAPLLAPFHAAHPDIVLEVVIENRLTDIVAGRFDAGVRIGERIQKDMTAVKLSPDLQATLVASPAYLARHGEPQKPRDLQRHRCINWRMPSDDSLYRWQFRKGKRSLEIAVDGPLIVTDVELAVQAAIDGLGIAYMYNDQIEAQLESGALQRILKPWSPSIPGFYIYYPSRRQTPPPLRAFIDFLRAPRRPTSPAAVPRTAPAR